MASNEEDDFEKELDKICKRRKIQTIVETENTEENMIELYNKIESLGRLKGENVFKNIELYPKICHDLFNDVSCLPISQASVERLFSTLKFMKNDLRCNLKDDIINDILFLNYNM